jgi:hypothetical protein
LIYYLLLLSPQCLLIILYISKFLYKELTERINKNIGILEDKGYSGFKKLDVEIPIKKNKIKYKENKDRACICLYKKL